MKKKIVLYEQPNGFPDSQNLYVVVNLEKWNENNLFIGDYHSGYPFWLGNDYIFFKEGICTGCVSLRLLNVKTKESHGAIYGVSSPDSNQKSYFKDRFGHKYTFNGIIDNIRSVTLDDKTYLIFQISHSDGSIYEQKFLFTGTDLKLL